MFETSQSNMIQGAIGRDGRTQRDRRGVRPCRKKSGRQCASRWAGTWAAIAVAMTLYLSNLATAADVKFSRDVLPILSANCFACHGPDSETREADLRLDQRESPLELGVLVPGDPESSELLRRINSSDGDEVMPPPESKKVLTSQQKQTLRQWIDEGAKYEAHWSFVPPQQTPPPTTDWPMWDKNPIDRFIAERLASEGLEPAREADRATLVRRVSLDLTGLPPSAAESAVFIADNQLDAYGRLVDRLLASPHYGERMALDWLDSARYADTNGFSIDGGRHMWLWRDWVIQAFNANMPYNEFLVEQIAGDLLPHRTDAQLIATGFQRNNMVTHEGGTIPAENLTNYNADRVKTYGEAVLGLTLGCAQCHDHKYDPITQRDYYQIFAYFNSLSDIGLDGDGGHNPRPSATLNTVLKPRDLAELPARIAALKERLEIPAVADIESWETRQRERLTKRGQGFALHPVKLLKVSTPNSGAGFDIVDNVVQISRPPGLAAYDVLLELPKTEQPITGFRIVFHRSEDASGGGLGYGTLPVVVDPRARRCRRRRAAPRPARLF